MTRSKHLEKQEQVLKQDDAKNYAPYVDQNVQAKLVEALGRLKAKATVPVLLKYLKTNEVVNQSMGDTLIEALESIGDKRAIDPLKKVAAGSDGRLVFAARLALIKIENDDPHSKWIAMLNYETLDLGQKNRVLYEMEIQPDPRDIPCILTLIKSDRDEAGSGIRFLGSYKYKAAVEALISCFDIDFEQRARSMVTESREDLYDDVANTLQCLTAQSFGPDKVQWQKWWDDEGKNLASLK